MYFKFFINQKSWYHRASLSILNTLFFLNKLEKNILDIKEFFKQIAT